MARHSSLLAALSAVALAGTAVPATAQGAPPPDKLQSFVVVLAPGAGAPAAAAARLSNRYGGSVGYVYEHALRGFVLTASPTAAAALESNPRVAYVEAVAPVSVADQTSPTGVMRTFATGNDNLDIDKIDDLRVDADVAVLDTGIDLDHADLNVTGHVSCLNVTSVSDCGGSGDDDHGHGTHVAGSAAALDNGIGVVGMAPGARLWSVKVLDRRGSGSNAGVAAGLDWVIAHNEKSSNDIEVANLSLGGGISAVMDDAVARAVGAGVTVVVAAGNDGKDAADYSPARAPQAITVSALADYDGEAGSKARYTCYADTDDTQANFSNYGSVIDVIAPGVCIYSTTVGGGYGTKSGTSMASPHVAGAAALLRSTGTSRKDTESALKVEGNYNWTNEKDGIQEPLLDVRDTTVFAPVMVAGSSTGDTGSGTTDPAGPTFTGTSSSQKSSWTATVTVAGATGTEYLGKWSNGGTPDSCSTTITTTSCQIVLPGIPKKTSSVTWTYSVDGTKVVINKP